MGALCVADVWYQTDTGSYARNATAGGQRVLF